MACKNGAQGRRRNMLSAAGSAAAAAIFLAAQTVQAQSAPPLQVIQAPATPLDLSTSQPPVPINNSTAYPVPALPAQAPGTSQVNLTVGTPDAPVYPGIPVLGNFLGVSIELSVADEIMGKTPQKVNIPFLNYMAAVQARARMGPRIRVGGNTQDTAVYNDSSTSVTPMITKISDHGFNPTTGAPITPSIEYNDLVFQVMQSLSQRINAHFVWGLNMVNYTAGFTELAVNSLERYLPGSVDFLLVGNEPDRYPATGNRDQNYDIPTYLNEWGDLTSRVMGSVGNINGANCKWTRSSHTHATR